MKVYTEVVWKWDKTKKELVEESSKSYEYEGPVVKAWAQYVALGLALLSAYSGYKGAQQKKKASGKKVKMMLNQADQYDKYAKELEAQGNEQAAHFMQRGRDLRKAYEFRGSSEIALSVAAGNQMLAAKRTAYGSSGARADQGSPVDTIVYQVLQNDINHQTIAFNMAMAQKTAMKQARHNAYVAKQNASSAADRARFNANQQRLGADALKEGAEINYITDMLSTTSGSLQTYYTMNNYKWSWS